MASWADAITSSWMPPTFKKIVGDYEVNTDDDTSLGSGSFATVFLGKHKKTGRPVAAKCVKLKNGKHDWEKVLAEIEILQKLSSPGHKNVLSILAHYKTPEESPKSLWIITEMCDQGTLDEYFSKNHNHISRRQSLKFMEQIASGMAYLHKCKIVHRDMKPNNLLMKPNERLILKYAPIVKIADFGESKFKDTLGSTMFTLSGTRAYMAPEVISYLTEEESQGNYKYPVDTYSTGITMYQMMKSVMVGSWIAIADLFAMPTPFEGNPVGFVSWKKRTNDWNPIYIEANEAEIDKATKNVLIRMVQYKPEKRPSMAEVEAELQHLQHTFKAIL